MLGASLIFALGLSLFLFVSPSLASPARARATPKLRPRDTETTPCGYIFESSETIFYASDAYDCLTSTPFDADIALQFIDYYNTTLQFQSTLAYLKNPPASYQQNSVDLLGGLEAIKNQINTGVFDNQYSFEAELQILINSAHDGHLNLFAGALSAFTFASPFSLVSLSVDGLDLPQIYITRDLFDALDQGLEWIPGGGWSVSKNGYAPSPITKIDGVEVDVYLQRFASLNTQRYRDPNADYNSLFYNAAADIQGQTDLLDGLTPLYPGDAITFEYENGTKTEDLNWVALFAQTDNPKLKNGQEFYDFFVKGIEPESAETEPPTSTAAETATATVATGTAAATTGSGDDDELPTAWYNVAYPQDPVIIQQFLGVEGGGVVSGYFIEEDSLAVLSIPSFDMYGEDDLLMDFSNTVGNFLTMAKKKGMQKVLVDLQANLGGDPLLATDTFKHFFPNIDPFRGSRQRASDLDHTLEKLYTGYFDQLSPQNDSYPFVAASAWADTDYLDAITGQNFTSVDAHFGPHPDHGDLFTTVQKDNLSSVVFDSAATGGLVVFGYGNRTTTEEPPYAAEDIVMLTDGTCSSSCSLFTEFMHKEAGVKTVVVGGAPQTGPMQGVGGTRGALSYSSYALDSDISGAQILQPGVQLPNRTDLIFWIVYSDVNLRDQIRKGEYFPLQFAYEAADCRLFYTPITIIDYKALWRQAADAIWSGDSEQKCVKDSTGHGSADPKGKTWTVAKDDQAGYEASKLDAPPSADEKKETNSRRSTDTDGASKIIGAGLREEDDPSPRAPTYNQPCKSSSNCGSLKCAKFKACQPVGSNKWASLDVSRCVDTCTENTKCYSPTPGTRYSCVNGYCLPPAPGLCTPPRKNPKDSPSGLFLQPTSRFGGRPGVKALADSSSTGGSGGSAAGGTKSDLLASGTIGSTIVAGLTN